MLSEQQNSALKIIVIIFIIRILRKKRIARRPDTNSLLSSVGYLKEILHGNPAHCQKMLRMKKETFINIYGHF